MPVAPDHPNAKYCVSRERYFKHRVEAEAEFERVKDSAADFALILYEKDADGEWEEADSAGYEK